jgi:hypothetical protein
MTLGEMLRFERLKAIRAPRRASIGIGGGSATAGAPVPITADQGPLPDGGNLGQQPMPNMQSGIVPGRNRMSIGNSARGNIDLGSFLSARPNQDALNQLAQNPLAQVDPYKATTGVGGFFRRLLGDDANERNEMAAGQRGQMLAQKWLMDQRNQGQMGLIDKEHQYAMERVKAQIEADNTRQATADQTALQRLRLQDQNNIGVEGMRAVNDLIAKSQDQSFLGRQNALNRDVTMRGQDLTSEAAGLRALLSQRSIPDKVILPEGSVYLNGQAYVPDENGKLQLFTGELGSGGFDPAAASPRSRELTAAKAAQNEIEKLQQPGTVLGGIGTAASDVGSAIGGAVGKAAPFVGAITGLSALGEEKDRLFNYFRRLESEKNARELMKRGLVNPIPTTE